MGSCTDKQHIHIFNNDFKNTLGTMYGKGGSGAIQYTNCSGSDFIVQDNAIENIEGESESEDCINIYHTFATEVEPTIVRNNWIRGGGPSTSGAGIQVGDWQGEHIIVTDNICVDTGSGRPCMSGGDHLLIKNNKAYAVSRPWTHVGMVIANWQFEEEHDYQISEDVTIRDNRIYWRDNDK